MAAALASSMVVRRIGSSVNAAAGAAEDEEAANLLQPVSLDSAASGNLVTSPRIGDLGAFRRADEDLPLGLNRKSKRNVRNFYQRQNEIIDALLEVRQPRKANGSLGRPRFQMTSVSSICC